MEQDEGDRLRRLSAVMRFLGHMRESADERELLLSLIQAGAVWYDLDARAYRRELNGRFVLEAWLPGADVTLDPHEVDVDAIVNPGAATHISSINELEQYGWQAVQGELLLLPIAAADSVRRILVVSGPVAPDVEATLLLVCRSAGSVLDHLAIRRGAALREQLVRTIGMSAGSLPDCLRPVIQQYLGVVEAAAARVAVMRPHQPAATLYATGDAWGAQPVPSLEPGAADVSAQRIALGLALSNGATAVIELLASPARPFTTERVQAAQVGAELLGVWLAGVSVGKVRGEAGKTSHDKEVVPPPFEDVMRQELGKAKRLSLSGGVLVASVPGAAVPDPRVLSVVIRTLRAQLRSADLLGQLAGGDIAAVLVRTSPEGVAKAAERVRERLDQLARARQLPPVVVGHALCPPGTGESATALVARARKQAGLLFS